MHTLVHISGESPEPVLVVSFLPGGEFLYIALLFSLVKEFFVSDHYLVRISGLQTSYSSCVKV